MTLATRRLTLLLIVLATIVATSPAAEVAVYFSPDGGARSAIVAEIEKAQAEVLVAAYALTDDHITAALLAAAKRGVQVAVVLDRRQTKANHSTGPVLARAGVPTRVDRREPLMHQKVIVIDRSTTLAGSFNFSEAAQTRNAEVLLVVRDPAVAQACAENFQTHWMHSQDITPTPSQKRRDRRGAAGPTHPAVSPACQSGRCERRNEPASHSHHSPFFKRRT
jgi:phosphatidylserine/phosphatidylglycerophosphate/cardiolipin synthase-like enzyme